MVPNMAVYDTCKHAVIGLTRSAAVDLGPDGIRVNAICPGYVLTPLVENPPAGARSAGGS